VELVIEYCAHTLLVAYSPNAHIKVWDALDASVWTDGSVASSASSSSVEDVSVTSPSAAAAAAVSAAAAADRVVALQLDRQWGSVLDVLSDGRVVTARHSLTVWDPTPFHAAHSTTESSRTLVPAPAHNPSAPAIVIHKHSQGSKHVVWAGPTTTFVSPQHLQSPAAGAGAAITSPLPLAAASPSNGDGDLSSPQNAAGDLERRFRFFTLSKPSSASSEGGVVEAADAHSHSEVLTVHDLSEVSDVCVIGANHVLTAHIVGGLLAVWKVPSAQEVADSNTASASQPQVKIIGTVHDVSSGGGSAMVSPNSSVSSAVTSAASTPAASQPNSARRASTSSTTNTNTSSNTTFTTAAVAAAAAAAAAATTTTPVPWIRVSLVRLPSPQPDVTRVAAVGASNVIRVFDFHTAAKDDAALMLPVAVTDVVVAHLPPKTQSILAVTGLPNQQM
jgi:hypothetical protein